MRSVILVAGAWLGAVACGGSPPAPSSPTPTPSAAVSPPVVTAAPPVVAVAPPAVVEPAPEPAPAAPPPTLALEVTKRACRGARLEMAAVAAACRVSGSETLPPMPAGITIAIAPSSLVVKPGKTLKAAVVYANTTAADVTLGLDDTCGHADDVSSSIQTAAGVHVDEQGDQCGHGEGCGRAGLGIVLTPGGTLRIPFVIDARLETFGPDCKEHRVGAVKPGSYELHVSSVAGEMVVPIRVGR